MFSHHGLPISSETLEYAWLIEITVGDLVGRMTSVQVSSFVRYFSWNHFLHLFCLVAKCCRIPANLRVHVRRQGEWTRLSKCLSDVSAHGTSEFMHEIWWWHVATLPNSFRSQIWVSKAVHWLRGFLPRRIWHCPLSPGLMFCWKILIIFWILSLFLGS